MVQTTNYIKHKKSTKNPINNFFVKNFNKAMVKEVKKLRPQSVLDVGCGEGFTLSMLKQNKIGKHLEGIDNMDDAIKLGHELHPTLTIKKGNIYKLPYNDNTFDLVICSEVLEHLEFPSRAVKELVRVSKKFVVLSVPNEPWFTVQRFLRGKNILELGDHPEHIQHWSSGKFKKFLGQFVVIKSIKTPLPWTLVSARKI